jgi:aldehyde:ferredoxin oxidoreductase
MDEDGLYRIGERVFNLQRAILAREGHRGKEADKLPEFSYTIPLESTPLNPDCLLPGEGGKSISRKGAVVDKGKFESMRDEYYCYRGWDIATGLQTSSKLESLELGDVAKVLAQKGLVI